MADVTLSARRRAAAILATELSEVTRRQSDAYARFARVAESDGYADGSHEVEEVSREGAAAIPLVKALNILLPLPTDQVGGDG